MGCRHSAGLPSISTKDCPMKKLIIRGGAVVILLLIVAVVGVFLALNPIVKNLVESQGTAGTGVATTLEGVNLRPFRGAATLTGLSLANPAGFDGEIFNLGQADVKINALSVMSDEIVVPTVAIDGCTVRVAFKDGKLNVMELVNMLQGDGTDTPVEEPAEDASGATKGFVVNSLSVTNTKVLGEIALPGLSPQTIDLTIADIVKTDVRGAEMKDVINIVIETIMLNAAQGLGGVVPNLDNLMGDLEGVAEEKLQEVEGKLNDAVGDIEKNLGGLLKGFGK